MSATQAAPVAVSLAELDRVLGLRRGQAAYLHKRGIFPAHEGGGRLLVVYDYELADVADLIRAYVQPPPGMSPQAAALRLGVELTTVYTLIKQGRLVRADGSSRRRGQLRITVESINDYEASRRRRKGDSHEGTGTASD